jgi:penicillin-binding protein 1B
VAIKVKIPRSKEASQPKRKTSRTQLSDPVIKTAVAAFIILCTAFLGVFAYYYIRYEKIIDRRMSGQIFSNSAKVFALPKTVHVGQPESAAEIATELRRAGYSEQGHGSESPIGTYRLTSTGIRIQPGPESYHSPDPAEIDVTDGKVARILGAGKEVDAYELEPQLLTALSTSDNRAKRQIVKYPDIPKVMVNAVLAIEDRRFFQHSGVNYFRLMEAALIDLREGTHGQGGSTLTMQMARAFFLTPEKSIKRKATEMLIAIELEHKLTKEQIFELYANQVDMGQRGSFTIVGFGEAAHAYFNKDLQSITLPEAALLAGLIQRPSYLSPYRHPERAMIRRNLVLDSMVETGAITREQAEQAKATPLKLAPMNVEASDAPYFVDLVKDQLANQYPENEVNEQGYRIYTTLDPELQRAAAESVQEGMKLVDEQVNKLRTRRQKVGTGRNARVETTIAPGPQAQVALVAIDPHTGDVLALVGGRNYGMSQLNHAVAKRPTGSIFKPFVYAAAMNTALASDAQNVETPISMIDDSPGTFTFGDQIYEPRNYKGEYHGQVTARYALAMSLNNATVRLAETVGYDNVAQLARQAGITSVKPTPAMALGAYDATPLEMAGAYTVFANGGVRQSPLLIRSVRDAQGNVLQNMDSDSRQVLDPRIAYIMTNMMEGVINFGTAYDVRRRGFTAPAAGKTGTSHDAWFAGYTSNLLCIVWVGYDDYSDLRLSGAVTAAPIWTEFMKRAVQLPEYRDVQDFTEPTGVVDVQLDKVSNLLVTPACDTDTYTAAFIAGTEPTATCEQGPGDHRNVFQKLFGLGQPPSPVVPPPSTPKSPHQQPQRVVTTAQQAPAQQPAQPSEKKKKGFWGKLAGVFKGDDNDQKQQQQPPPKQ